MSVVHINFLKKNSNLQRNYKDYGHDLGLGLGLGLELGLGLGLGFILGLGLAVGELVREQGSSL